MSKKNNTWEKINMWKDLYNQSPNGWALAQLIGSDYIDNKPAYRRNKKNA